ncbi:hypothetical protein IPN35_03300 [Candidatus Peregrinibacteria bacterium]|nr:MAG: hypothetical protein IPN35_03300 [Candidatus Peregrinibacteria bacterium]
MAEEGFGFESLGAQSAPEQSGESMEQFSERYHQTQAAIAQIRKEESQKRAHDTSLAHIITQFLHQKGRTPFFLLIARLSARNIPSDLILSILALIFPPAAEAIGQKLNAEEMHALSAPSSEKEHIFSPKEKKEIDFWTNAIAGIARKEPRRILRTAILPDASPVPELVQIFALILREFLEKNGQQNMPLDYFSAFGKVFFENIFSSLSSLVGKEHLLSEG